MLVPSTPSGSQFACWRCCLLAVSFFPTQITSRWVKYWEGTLQILDWKHTARVSGHVCLHIQPTTADQRGWGLQHLQSVRSIPCQNKVRFPKCPNSNCPKCALHQRHSENLTSIRPPQPGCLMSLSEGITIGEQPDVMTLMTFWDYLCTHMHKLFAGKSAIGGSVTHSWHSPWLMEIVHLRRNLVGTIWMNAWKENPDSGRIDSFVFVYIRGSQARKF